MRYEEAIRVLFGLESFGVKLGLDNIRLFTERLGQPQNRFAAIHVAGTNGKGTVCSTLAAVLTTAGYKTGLFTSPHLVDYRERIRIDGQRIPKNVVSRFMQHQSLFIRRNRITFFETTTAMAFAWFADSGCDIAVVEVGLGGRLDATNVLRPVLTVITSIDFDHTKTLGATRRRIAGEKAGIIKPGVPIVCAPLTDSAKNAIATIARRRSAPLVETQRLVNLRPSLTVSEYEVISRRRFPSPIKWPYPGLVHQTNLRTVIAALLQLRRDGYRLSDRQIKHGLAHTRWPGRFQIRRGRPLMIYDVAHNAAAGEGLAQALPQITNGKSTSAVCAIAQDKDWPQMIRSLKPLVDRWYFTRFRNKRSWLLKEVTSFARRESLAYTSAADPQRMLTAAKSETPRDGTILVFGSHFLVGRVIPRSLIDPAPLGK